VLLSGSIEVSIATDNYTLNAGDALLLDPKSPHSFYNPGPAVATMLWVQTPPLF
jgi:mannose-6-phosphate isomerase-like protein (cupin superfamily)